MGRQDRSTTGRFQSPYSRRSAETRKITWRPASNRNASVTSVKSHEEFSPISLLGNFTIGESRAALQLRAVLHLILGLLNSVSVERSSNHLQVHGRIHIPSLNKLRLRIQAKDIFDRRIFQAGNRQPKLFFSNSKCSLNSSNHSFIFSCKTKAEQCQPTTIETQKAITQERQFARQPHSSASSRNERFITIAHAPTGRKLLGKMLSMCKLMIESGQAKISALFISSPRKHGPVTSFKSHEEFSPLELRWNFTIGESRAVAQSRAVLHLMPLNPVLSWLDPVPSCVQGVRRLTSHVKPNRNVIIPRRLRRFVGAKIAGQKNAFVHVPSQIGAAA